MGTFCNLKILSGRSCSKGDFSPKSVVLFVLKRFAQKCLHDLARIFSFLQSPMCRNGLCNRVIVKQYSLCILPIVQEFDVIAGNILHLVNTVDP